MTISQFTKKLLSRTIVGNCLGMALLSMLLLILALIFVNHYTNHGEEVEIPNVCGIPEEVALKKLKALGLKGEISDTGYVYSAAPFAILEQSLQPGQKVKVGRIVKLTINADGPRKIALPDVADNCSRREAEIKLKALGFKLGAVEYVQGDPEWVVGIKVGGKTAQAGDRVSAGTPIVLVVGKGGIEDEYNGNDSLDYILNAPTEEELLEGETEDAPTNNHAD